MWDGTVANNQVGLGTNTMDGNTTADETFDHGNEVGELCARVVQVVVIEVQLCARVGSSSGLEGDIKEFLPEESVEDRVTECSAFLEDFVCNIPVYNLTLIPGHDGGDVVLNDRSQGSSIGDVGDPTWQLRVPDQSVTSDLLTVGCCVVDQVVSSGQGEGSPIRLSRIPLHGILWSQNTELSFNDSVDLAYTEGVLINSGSKVPVALSLHLRIQATSASWIGGGGGRSAAGSSAGLCLWGSRAWDTPRVVRIVVRASVSRYTGSTASPANTTAYSSNEL